MSIAILIPNWITDNGFPLLDPPPPVLWTPPLLGASLRGYWDPHTLAYTPGDPVGMLASSGGISNTLVQGSAPLKPLYQLLNSRGALSFLNASGHHMLMSDLSISNNAAGLVMGMVYQFSAIPTDALNKHMMAVRLNVGSSHRMSLQLNNTSGTGKLIGLSYCNNDGAGAVNRYSVVVADTSIHMIIGQVVFNGSGAPKLDIWLDGSNILSEVPAFTPANTTASDSNSAYIGGNPAATAFGISGLIGESMIYKGSIPVTDRQKLEGYWAYIYGMQANLPGDHPYKSAPYYLPTP